MSDSKWQDMKRLLTAWQGVWRSRCCPHVQVLGDANMQEMLQEHLALCPWCREAVRTGSFKAAASVADRLKAFSKDASVPTPAPGMIFFLSPELGAWGTGGRYINPPAVLVISPPENSEVNVAQVCAGSIFLGPGDIPLGNGLHGYAQAWNTYRVSQSHFSLLAADTGDASAKAVIDAMIDLSDADGPEPGSIAWFYRHLELETGQFIAEKSCRGDLSANWLLSIAPGQLSADLASFGFSVPEEFIHSGSLEQIILMSDPPDEVLLFAASGGRISSGISLPALIFSIRNSRIRDVKTVPATITFTEYAGGVYRLTGKIEAQNIPEIERARLHWIVRIETGSESLQPIAGMSGSKGTMFWAAFGIPDAKMIRPNDLKIRITAHEPPDHKKIVANRT